MSTPTLSQVVHHTTLCFLFSLPRNTGTWLMYNKSRIAQKKNKVLWDSQDGRADNWIKYHLLICNSIGCMIRYILIQQSDWVKSPFWKYDYRQVRLLFLCSSDVCLKYEVWGFTFRSTFFLWSTFSRLRWATPYAFWRVSIPSYQRFSTYHTVCSWPFIRHSLVVLGARYHTCWEVG